MNSRPTSAHAFVNRSCFRPRSKSRHFRGRMPASRFLDTALREEMAIGLSIRLPNDVSFAFGEQARTLAHTAYTALRCTAGQPDGRPETGGRPLGELSGSRIRPEPVAIRLRPAILRRPTEPHRLLAMQYLSERPTCIRHRSNGCRRIGAVRYSRVLLRRCTLKARACLDGAGFPNSGEGRPDGSSGLPNHKS